MLDPKKLGLAGALLCGLTMFVMTMLSVLTGYAHDWLAFAGSVYPGYDVTFVGSLVGFVYGFIDGFVGLFLLAWFYNKLPKIRC